MLEEFEKCAVFSYDGGVLYIRCKKFLWAVSGGDYERVLREAFHYFAQYYEDGEYDD